MKHSELDSLPEHFAKLGTFCQVFSDNIKKYFYYYVTEIGFGTTAKGDLEATFIATNIDGKKAPFYIRLYDTHIETVGLDRLINGVRTEKGKILAVPVEGDQAELKAAIHSWLTELVSQISTFSEVTGTDINRVMIDCTSPSKKFSGHSEVEVDGHIEYILRFGEFVRYDSEDYLDIDEEDLFD